MFCAEIHNLTRRYERAVRAYRLAVIKLIDKRGEEFLKHSREVDRQNLVARKAYLDLESHIRKHGCGYDLSTGAFG
jgi:hypothetical protein